jgi:TolA-binding protein
MTAPRTRVTEGATDFERDLLRSWEKEQPSEAARQGAIALVGVAAALGASTTASTAAAAGLKAATGSMAPKAATVGAAALGKWILVGTGLVALAVGGVTVEYARSSSKATPAMVTVTATPTPTPTATATPTPTPTPTATPPAEVPPPPQPPLAATPPAVEPRPPAPPPPLGLGQQVAALDHARDALASGNAGGALRQLDEYDRQFPRGALAQEATALRIEALLQQGHRDAAVLLAERFLASNPKSPHAARIRLLVERPYNP